jgi:hypothetical protein
MTDRDIQRDRLIEIIKYAEDNPEKTCPHYLEADCYDCPYDKGEECDHVARKADYLLANGVFILPEDLRGTEEFSISAFIEAMQMYKEKDRYIKPPCDIGQTVYTIYGYSFKIQRIEVLEDRKIIFRCGNDGTDDYMAFYDFEIGTDVFLTKEEAENALVTDTNVGSKKEREGK